MRAGSARRGSGHGMSAKRDRGAGREAPAGGARNPAVDGVAEHERLCAFRSHANGETSHVVISEKGVARGRRGEFSNSRFVQFHSSYAPCLAAYVWFLYEYVAVCR